jgi:hypothetical protein
MKSLFPRLVPAAILIALATLRSYAQTPGEWHDDLVEHMTGSGKGRGQIMGRDAHHEIQAEWVLNHMFLRIHESTSTDAPGSEKRYEAIWFLGYDPVSEKYVLHLFDVFETRFSETLGYGTRDGNFIHFTFEYPDGPFHTTFRWLPENGGGWQWLMEQKRKDGK